MIRKVRGNWKLRRCKFVVQFGHNHRKEFISIRNVFLISCLITVFNLSYGNMQLSYYKRCAVKMLSNIFVVMCV